MKNFVELLGSQLAGNGGVEDRKVRVLTVETVIGFAVLLFLVKLPREIRPNVVIAGRKVKRIVTVARPDRTQLAPLLLGGGILPALNGIADIDHELRVHQVDFSPDTSVDLRLGAACAVTQNSEAEIIPRFFDGADGNRGEGGQHNSVHGSAPMDALHTESVAPP